MAMVITSSICFAELYVTALFYVMYLLILRRLCIVYWSRVEWKLPVPVSTCLIAWLEVNMFVKMYGLHSLIKRVSALCINVTNPL